MSDPTRLLRKQCMWQRVQGTKLDSGYPYGEHLQDCEICQGAERIEHLEAALKHIGNATWILEDGSGDINVMDYANEALK